MTGVQADTIIPSPGNPLAWDRYAYANNNPLYYTDPSGHKPIYDDDTPPIPTQTPTPLPQMPTSTPSPISSNTSTPTLTPTITPTQTPTPPSMQSHEGLLDKPSTTMKYMGYGADVLNMLKLINVPGYFGFFIDVSAQLFEDVGSEHSTYQRIGRALVLGFEGQLIGSLATGAGATVGGITAAPTGPGAVVAAVATYGLVTYSGEGIFYAVNDNYVFPWLEEIIK